MMLSQIKNQSSKSQSESSNSRNLFFLYILYIIYFNFLVLIYKNYVSPIYEYQGFQYSNNDQKYIIAFISLMLIIFLSNFTRGLIFKFLNLTSIFIFVPSFVLFCMSDWSYYFLIVNVTSFLVIYIFSFFSIFRSRFGRVPSKKMLLSIFILVTTVIVLILYINGTKYVNFNISKVYDFRSDSAENLPGIFSYIIPITGKVILPFAISVSFLQKKWIYFLTFIFGSILLFALTAHKSTLFYPFLVIALVWLSSKQRNIELLLIAIIGILMLASFDFWLLEQGSEYEYAGLFGSIFVRRALFVPSLLNSYYVDWFSTQPKYYWANSSFTFGLIEAPETLRAPFLIGQEYFNKPQMSANTGWIGSGYANAGLVGVYVYSAVIGLLFSLFDAYARRLGAPLVTGLFAIPVIAMLTSSDLTTMFLTHGLLVALVLLVIIQPIQPSHGRSTTSL